MPAAAERRVQCAAFTAASRAEANGAYADAVSRYQDYRRTYPATALAPFVDAEVLDGAISAWLVTPHAHLAIQFTRRRQSPTSRTWHTETVYAITDMTSSEIRANQIAQAIRGRWSIENRLHWIRNVVFAEEAR